MVYKVGLQKNESSKQYIEQICFFEIKAWVFKREKDRALSMQECLVNPGRAYPIFPSR